MRLQQDMATFDLIATLINQLNDMESEFGLHNLGDFLRVCQVECHVGKSRIQHTTACIVKFTALTSSTRILRIKARQSCESCFATIYTICIFTKFVLNTIDLFLFDMRCKSHNLHFHCSRDEGNTVFRQVLEIHADISRTHLDVFHQFFLHFLYQLTVTEIVVHRTTHLSDGLLTVLFQLFLTSTYQLQPVVNLLFNIHVDLTLRYFDGVNSCLMEIEFLYGNLLGNRTVRIPREMNAFCLTLQAHGFHITFENGLISHHPDNFVHDTGLIDNIFLYLDSRVLSL